MNIIVQRLELVVMHTNHNGYLANVSSLYKYMACSLISTSGDIIEKNSYVVFVD